MEAIVIQKVVSLKSVNFSKVINKLKGVLESRTTF